jgi:ppGpp synthetase/RelA/SpoT-type nucleotidyltranferase
MTDSRPTRPNLKRTLAVVALMAAHNVTPAECFGTAATMTESKTSLTKRFFTMDENMGIKTNDFYNTLPINPLHPSTFTSDSSTLSKMPTWLGLQKSHLVHENFGLLRDAMLESFFTENEVLKLRLAIQEASNGESNKIAGAAEFCLIMAETMEMGLNALVAAAFHYCYCVAARERSLLPRYQSQSDVSPWESQQHHKIESFGQHAVQIERDAARLKRLEVVASLIVHNSNNSHRVTPDANGADNLRKLFLTEAKDWRALAIRGAACLFRLRGILKSGTSHKLTKETNRACREALSIYVPLASRLGMHRLKNELEAAAFRILYRRQHETVTALLQQTRDNQNVHLARRETFPPSNSAEPNIGESMGQILAQVQTQMTEILKNDPEFSSSVEDFDVTARVKESYSTWKKMLRSKFDHILQVPDALALRVVLTAKKEFEEEPEEVTRARERALCYYAQQLCMERWAPHQDDPRFKDYIAIPKANGYQSLHYTASTEWRGEEWSVEIQVRSGDMNKVAEFGVASHWNYKARSKPAKNSNADKEANYAAVTIDEHFGKVPLQNSDAYLRSLQEWHWKQHGGAFEKDATPSSEVPMILSDEADSQLRAERIRARTKRLAPYIEALTAAQSDLARENVFVFLSQPEHKDSKAGTLLALPAGAVVIDAIRAYEFPIINEDVITHNGLRAVLTSRLNNGDVLSIPSVAACVTPSF